MASIEATPPPTIVLHTDTYRYPAVHVIQHTRHFRVAVLKDGDEVRSLAVTLFPCRMHSSLSEVDAAIKNGGLMGMTFRAHGLTVAQNQLWLGEVCPPAWVRSFFPDLSEQRMQAEVYEFYGDGQLYGRVVEFTPPGKSVPTRPAYGSRYGWLLAGKVQEFQQHLSTSTHEELPAHLRTITRVVAMQSIVRSYGIVAQQCLKKTT